MRQNRIGLGFTLALHLVAVTGLLSHAPARKALLAATPIMVELISPPRIGTPQPVLPAERPKSRRAEKAIHHSLEAAPVLAAPAEASSPTTVPLPASAPALPAEVPVAVTQPIYSADYLDNPAPPYPALSRRIGEQGRVLLHVRVNAAGGTDEVQVHGSSGYARLDYSARETVRRWKFVPARRGSEPVAAWVLIPVSFRIES